MEKSSQDTQEHQHNASRALSARKQRLWLGNDEPSRVEEHRHAAVTTSMAVPQSSHQWQFHETNHIQYPPMDNVRSQGSSEPPLPKASATEFAGKKQDSFQTLRHPKRPRCSLSMPNNDSEIPFLPKNDASISYPQRMCYQEQDKFPAISGDASLRPSNSSILEPRHQMLPPSGYLQNSKPSEKFSAESCGDSYHGIFAGERHRREKVAHDRYQHLTYPVYRSSSLSHSFVHDEPPTLTLGRVASSR